MTTSASSSTAPGLWVDGRSPTDTRSLEVGFSSMSVGTQSTKGHTIRPPVLSISSTSGDGSVLLKQYQSPSCPLPQTQGFGAWPYAVLDSGTLHPSFHCNYYTRDNREAAVPPVRDSSDSIDYNLEGTTSPAVFDIGKRVDQSDVFLKSGMGRAPGSRPKFAPGGGAALDSKKTDNSLSRLSTPDVRGMKNSGGECRPTIEQPESGGLSLSPLISRSVVSGTKGSMGCSSLGMSNASEFSENASSAKPFNRWDLEQGNATGQRLDRPIAMRDRAFSSPGPMEASRLGSGSIAPVGVATHSPSAKSLSDVWEDGRFNEHDLTSSNVQFRNFTGGHIPELSSTDNENLSCTGFFGGIRRGRSLMAFNLPYDNVEKKEFCENEVKRDFSCDVAQHDDSNFLYNARNDAQGTSSLPLAGNNEQYIKECRVFGDNGSRARATSFGEVMHSGFLINSPWGGNRGGDREGIGVPADRTGSIVDEHQSEQLAQCSQYHRSTRSETNNFFEPFLGGGGGGQNMSDDLVCRDTIIGDEAGCSPPPGLPIDPRRRTNKGIGALNFMTLSPCRVQHPRQPQVSCANGYSDNESIMRPFDQPQPSGAFGQQQLGRVVPPLTHQKLPLVQGDPGPTIAHERQGFLQSSDPGQPTRVFVPGMGTIIVQTGPRGENVGHFARSLPESNATGFPRSNSSTSIEASPHRDVYSHHRQMNDSGVSGRRNYNISRAAPFPVEVVQGTRHEAKASHGAYTHIVSNDEFQNVQGRIGGPKRSVSQGSVRSQYRSPYSSSVHTGMERTPPDIADDHVHQPSWVTADDYVDNRHHKDAGPGLLEASQLCQIGPTVSTTSLSSSSSSSHVGTMLPLLHSAPEVCVTGQGVGLRYVFNIKFKRTQRAFVLGNVSVSDVKVGCYVKVEADRGEDLGVVQSRFPTEKFNLTCRSTYRNNAPPEQSVGGASDLKKIIRLASREEISLLVSKREEEDNLLKVCRAKVKQRGLPMSVVDAEYQFDHKKLIFFFEAEGRIDFRELVRDLFSIYKTRIWMQQLDKGGSSNSCGSVCEGSSVGELSHAADPSITD